MPLKIERLPDGRVRAYDTDDSRVEGIGATQAEAVQKASEIVRVRQRPTRRSQAIPDLPADRTSTNEPAAEETLSYLGKRYVPVADRLLKAHHLKVPQWARAMIATRIATLRELPAGTEGRPQSPIPALKSARKHLARLREYTTLPPAKKSSVATRCTRLRRSLLSGGGLLALVLAEETVAEDATILEGDKADLGKLLDELEAGSVDAAELKKWGERIEKILSRHEDWRLGQPQPLIRRVVKDGCIAWNAAGRKRSDYSHRFIGGKEKVDGPLPKFLEDLINLCNGTHEWVKKPPRRIPEGYPSAAVPRRGNGLKWSDTAVYQAILDYFPAKQHDADKN